MARIVGRVWVPIFRQHGNDVPKKVYLIPGKQYRLRGGYYRDCTKDKCDVLKKHYNVDSWKECPTPGSGYIYLKRHAQMGYVGHWDMDAKLKSEPVKLYISFPSNEKLAEELRLRENQDPTQWAVITGEKSSRETGWVELNIDFKIPATIRQDEPNTPAFYSLRGDIDLNCHCGYASSSTPMCIIEEYRDVEAI